MDVIGFYRVGDQYGEFSNFYKAKMTIPGHTRPYLCMEQWIMHQKAILFQDIIIAYQIMNCTDPAQCKRLGRQVQNFSQPVWDKAVWGVTLMGLNYKFTSDPRLKALLLGTRGNLLAECSPRDCIWGIGLSVDDPRAKNPTQWRGTNLLGQCLMLVRDNLLAMELPDPE